MSVCRLTHEVCDSMTDSYPKSQSIMTTCHMILYPLLPTLLISRDP